MGDRDGLAGLKDGEDGRVRQLGRVGEGVLDLHAREAGARTAVVRDGEGVGREGVQGATGVVEELEGLVASVGERRGDLEVLDTVDSIYAGDLEGEAGCGNHSGRGGGEGEEGGADGGGEHVVNDREVRLGVVKDRKVRLGLSRADD